MIAKKNKLDIYLKLSEYFPHSGIIYIIIIIIKFLPLFIVTHDWNLNDTRSLCHYLRILTLSEFFNVSENGNHYNFYIKIYNIISLITFILSIYFILLPFYLFHIYNNNFYHFKNNQKKIIQISSFILFYFMYLLNQYMYSIYVEIFYQEKKNIFYYLSLFFSGVSIIFTICLSIWINILIYEPLFIENYSFFSFPFLKYNNFIFIFPVLQIIIQLERHIKFKKFLTTKHLIRGFYCLFYIYSFFSSNYVYVRKYYDYFIRYFFSLCFASCLIEWGTYGDLNNDLEILIKDKSVIIIKIFLEIIVSYVLTEIFYKKEKKDILKTIDNLTSKEEKKNNNNQIIKFLNLLYYRDDVNELKKLIEKIYNNSENVDTSKKISEVKKKTTPSFSLVKFLNEKKDFFLDIKNKTNREINDSNEIHIFYKKFSSLYKFMELKLKERVTYDLNIKKNNKYIENVFSLILFYYTFERNYFKAFYLLEQIKKTKEFKDSFFCYSKVKYFYHHLKRFYKNYMYTYLTQQTVIPEKMNQISLIQKTYVNFAHLNNVILATNCIKNTLISYSNIMNKIMNETEIKFDDYYEVLWEFNLNYKQTVLLNKRILNRNNSDFFELQNLRSDFGIFQNFFNSSNIKKLKNLNEQKNNKTLNDALNFIPDENPDILNFNTDLNYYIIIIKIEQFFETMKFNINYCSEKFISLIKYNSDELKTLMLNELFPKNFSKQYTKIITEKILEGITTFDIKNFFFCDKQKYVHKLDIQFITLFSDDGMRIYLKIYEKSEIDNCCIITNKIGKITFITKLIENFFFVNSQIFHKCQINFEDLFKINLNTRAKAYNIIDIYNNILSLLTDSSITDISQKIGDEEYSNIIKKIRDMIFQLNTNHLDHLQVIINSEKQKLTNEKNISKEFYCINIKIFNPVSKSVIFDLENFINNYRSKSIRTKALFLNIEKERNVQVIGKFIKSDLYERMCEIRSFSINLLAIFYNTEIEKQYLPEDLNNKDENNNNNNNNNNNDFNIVNGDNTPLSQENKINENTKLLKEKNLCQILSIDVPPLSSLRLLGIFFLVIIFIGIVIYCLILKMNKLHNQELYVNLLIEILMFRSMYLNIFTDVLFYQLKSNSLQNIFYDNNFTNFKNNMFNKIKDLINYETEYSEFYQNHFSTFYEFNKYISERQYTLSIPTMDGKFTNESYSVSFNDISIYIKYIVEEDNIKIFYNNSEYYFQQEENEDSELYFIRKAYIIIIDNFLVLYRYHMAEFMNSILNLVIFKNLYGNSLETYCLIFVAIAYIIFVIIAIIIFVKMSKYSYIRYFIIFNQLLFFYTYINKKISILLEYFSYNELDENKKSNHLYTIVKLIKSKKELNNLTLMLNEQMFENINQIRIKPFKIENLNDINQTTEKKKKKKVVKSNSKKNINNNGQSSIQNFAKDIFKSVPGFKFKKLKYGKNNGGSSPSNSNNNNQQKDITKNISSMNSPITANSKNSLLSNNTAGGIISSNLENNNMQNTPGNNKKKDNQNLIFDLSGHKLLENSLKYISLKIFLPIILIFYLMLNLVEIIVTKNCHNNTKDILNAEFYLFNVIFFLMEAIQIHIYTLLKNDDILINFESPNYLSYCPEIETLDDNHEIFNDCLKCFNYYDNFFNKYLGGDINSAFPEMKKYLINLNSEYFCKYFAEKVMESQSNDNSFYYMHFLIDDNLTTIQKKCENIGNFTSKGLGTIVESIYTEIKNLHRDFTDDPLKTNETILLKFNSDYLIIIQKVIYNIFDKLPISFAFSFLSDYSNYQNKIKRLLIIFVLIQLLMILIITFYYFLESKNYGFEEENIVLFTERLGNTILY